MLSCSHNLLSARRPSSPLLVRCGSLLLLFYSVLRPHPFTLGLPGLDLAMWGFLFTISFRYSGTLDSWISCCACSFANALRRASGGMLRMPLRWKWCPAFAFPRSYWVTPPLCPSGWLTTMSPSRISCPCSGLGIAAPIPPSTLPESVGRRRAFVMLWLQHLLCHNRPQGARQSPHYVLLYDPRCMRSCRRKIV